MSVVKFFNLILIYSMCNDFSDSSVDLSTSIEHAVEANGVDCLQTPFTSDLGVSSNRSSIISQVMSTI